ncbi:UDP-glucose:undecaprenyl-phosphate glucose-1-phosphate transferase [mine drainage metagenome]|uniref:UDP-glucose:undecaprenyl-phosphate glucose-1-phosphate transferase n=1 Tax=mine drainage metagenome TaxID=410659 RepID=A0A1J5SUI2_9ZZZZ
MTNDISSDKSSQIIALINCTEVVHSLLLNIDFKGRQIRSFQSGLAFFNQSEKQKLNIVAVISQSEVMAPGGISLLETIRKKSKAQIPFFLVCNNLNDNISKIALKAGIAEIFVMPLSIVKLQTRINFLIEYWDEINNKRKSAQFKPYKTPLIKRMFDLFFAGLALLCLSPLFLIVYVLIKLESKGPAFYYSLRVGTGYRVFKFYKFRSMFADADKRLKDLKHLNQYAEAKKDNSSVTEITEESGFLCDDCKRAGTKCKFPIYADNIQWCEKEFNYSKKNKGSAFIKLKDDPRITKVGKFIRNTSIDELPQLWNVIIGDMSIVGNRPLPLYEAEKLTTDKYALRFMAPAGITGLWQVEKRGKGEMSEDERLMLDNVYAKNHSFINDIKLILKTIPALFQKENV